MKKVIYHIVKLFRKFWVILGITLAISPIMLLIVLVVGTIVSMTMFDDYVEPKSPADYFTEEELRMIQSGEKMDDEDYLRLAVKYDAYECPVKIDPVTTWTSSELTKDAYICNYEINDKWHRYHTDVNVVRSKALASIDRSNKKVQCLIATNRSMILRYWNRQTNAVEDVVFTTDELKG